MPYEGCLDEVAIDSGNIARAVVHALNQPKNMTVNDPIASPARQDWRSRAAKVPPFLYVGSPQG
jgi:hypothetical protein